jgi:hypothetical protein
LGQVPLYFCCGFLISDRQGHSSDLLVEKRRTDSE